MLDNLSFLLRGAAESCNLREDITITIIFYSSLLSTGLFIRVFAMLSSGGQSGSFFDDVFAGSFNGLLIRNESLPVFYSSFFCVNVMCWRKFQRAYKSLCHLFIAVILRGALRAFNKLVNCNDALKPIPRSFGFRRCAGLSFNIN